jgi:hypothetical protein
MQPRAFTSPTIVPDGLVFPSRGPSGQVTFHPESLNTILAGQPIAPIKVGNQESVLCRIPLGSSGMAAPLFRDGGYQLKFASREVYLDSSGTCVEVRDLTTGQRFHPRNLVVQSFLERFAAAGIKPGLGGENTQIQPISYQPNTALGLPQSTNTAIFPKSSSAEWYLLPRDKRHTPHLARKGVSDEEITNFANLVERVFQRHGMTLNRAQIIAITATSLQENALRPDLTEGGLGAFQHIGVRADALRRFMPAYRQQFGGASNLEAQIAFVAHEMFGLRGFPGMRGATYKHAGNPFRNSKSVTDAMSAMGIFEGYGDSGKRYLFAKELDQILHQREKALPPAFIA